MTERDELIGAVNRYLDALAERDASKAGLAPDVRYTENGQEIAPGTGLWALCDARWPGGSYFADVQEDVAGYFGALVEAGRDVVLGLRLKLTDGLVSEAEALVVRASRIMDPGRLAQPRDIIGRVLTPEERRTRDELLRIANLYFEGIEQGDGDMIPVRHDCLRIENGVQTILNRDWPNEAFRLGVREQINRGFTKHIARARDRRFFGVDEERGLVFAALIFDHPGPVRGREDSPFKSPSSMLVLELFKIAYGEIFHIEAVGDVFPYGMKPGW